MAHNSSLSSDVEVEITPLEYARQNGIAQDYLNDKVRSIENLCNIITHGVQYVWNCNEEPPPFDFGPAFKVEEKPTLSKEAALLLATVRKLDSLESYNATVTALLDSRQRKRLKIWESILRSDHELDLQEFRRRDNFEVALDQIRLPLELVDDEKDEGLVWSTAHRQLGPVMIQSLKSEKPIVKRETLQCIQNAYSCSWGTKDAERIFASLITYKKNKALEPITPPLLPIEPHPELYEPDSNSETFELPVLSDPISLTQLDLARIENDFMERDAPTPIRNLSLKSSSGNATENTLKLKDIYSPLASIDNSSSPAFEIQPFKRNALKVEGPLTPKLPIYSPDRTVNFASIAYEYNYDAESLSSFGEIDSRFFEEALGPAHERVTRLVEQEKLVAADALSRVMVPKMDFSMPKSTWQGFDHEKSVKGVYTAQRQLIQNTFIEAGSDLSVWPISRTTIEKLNWVPFDTTAVRACTKDFFPHTDEAWNSYIRDEIVIDSSSQTWKPPGLRILKAQDDDEDDIEAGTFAKVETEDMASLIRKRKSRMDELEVLKKSELTDKQERLTSTRQQTSMTKGDGEPLNSARNSSLLGGPFSAMDSVDNFMEIRGTKKVKHGDSQFFKPTHSEAPTQLLRASTPSQHLSLPVRRSPASETVLPVPKFQIPEQEFSIIMSTAIFQKKDLVKTLDRTIPSLQIVERDFSAHNSITWLQGTVSRSPVKSPLADEADFVVSPCLGIIITTIQKVKQKPPPGHKGQSEIRNRVENVSLRYENLLILVSEDNRSDGTNGMDSYNAQAFAEFLGFGTKLDCNVTVQYVAGGIKTLYQWIMNAIVQNRVQESLLAEQTHWEVFLRRAGMNAFAAQSILGMLRPPEVVTTAGHTEAGQFGLVAFVKMGREERIVRFGGICGLKVLQRVSDIIDARWQA